MSFCRTLASNCRGFDFIVGDLHGCYDTLLEALASQDFDARRGDRLISVGDLIDRGPRSLECLRLIREPWFHYVLGNHELMLLSWLGRSRVGIDEGKFLRNGGAWVTRLDAQQRDELTNSLVPLLEEAPFALHVEDEVLAFNVVHAELAWRGPLALADDDHLLAGCIDPMPASWGRRVFTEGLEEHLRHGHEEGGVLLTSKPRETGLSPTYAGHCIHPQPLLHRSHLFIDSGASKAVEPYGLTLLRHRSMAPFLKQFGF